MTRRIMLAIWPCCGKEMEFSLTYLKCSAIDFFECYTFQYGIEYFNDADETSAKECEGYNQEDESDFRIRQSSILKKKHAWRNRRENPLDKISWNEKNDAILTWLHSFSSVNFDWAILLDEWRIKNGGIVLWPAFNHSLVDLVINMLWMKTCSDLNDAAIFILVQSVS